MIKVVTDLQHHQERSHHVKKSILLPLALTIAACAGCTEKQPQTFSTAPKSGVVSYCEVAKNNSTLFHVQVQIEDSFGEKYALDAWHGKPLSLGTHVTLGHEAIRMTRDNLYLNTPLIVSKPPKDLDAAAGEIREAVVVRSEKVPETNGQYWIVLKRDDSSVEFNAIHSEELEKESIVRFRIHDRQSYSGAVTHIGIIVKD